MSETREQAPPSPTGREAREAPTPERIASFKAWVRAHWIAGSVPEAVTGWNLAEAYEAQARAAALGAAAPVPAGAQEGLLHEMLSALQGVVRVADRATVEFVAARTVIAKAEAALGAAAPQTAEPKARAVALAQRFHETYERLAPMYGYETRRESAKPWAEVPEQNRQLMVAVCAELLAAAPVPAGARAPSEPPEERAVASQLSKSYDGRARADERWLRVARVAIEMLYVEPPSSGPAVPAGEPQATLGRLREAVEALEGEDEYGIRVWRKAVVALIDAEQMRAVVPDTEDAR